MHEEDLRFVNAVNKTKICDNRSKVMAMPDLSIVPKEEWTEHLERHEEAINRRTFDQGACQADDIKHHALRKSWGSFSTPVPTLEDRDAEANNLLPYTIKSKKEDVELEKAEYEEAIIYKEESISEKSHKEADSHFSGNRSYVTVRSSQYLTQIVSIRDWDEHVAKTKDEIALLTAWRDFLNSVIAMYNRKLKERIDPETVNAILKEAQQLISEHKKLLGKINEVIEKSADSVTFGDAKTFTEGRERMRLIESELNTLGKKYDAYDTSPEILFPSLANDLTSNELHYNQFEPKPTGKTIKELEDLYRKRMEATTKA